MQILDSMLFMSCGRLTLLLGQAAFAMLSLRPVLGAIQVSFAKSVPAPGNNVVQLRRIDTIEAPREQPAEVKKYKEVYQFCGSGVLLISPEKH